MKIFITTTGDNLQSEVDPRFGRCKYLLLVDTESMDFQAFPNPYLDKGRGVGIQTAQFVVQQGVKIILTGSCGPNAYEVLDAGGVGVITGVSGIASEMIERFKAGRFSVDDKPSVQRHWGNRPGIGGDPAPESLGQ